MLLKELVHAFSCAYIKLWMHLGSLEESTQEARVCAAAPQATLTLLSCLANFPHVSITQCMHTKYETIL